MEKINLGILVVLVLTIILGFVAIIGALMLTPTGLLFNTDLKASFEAAVFVGLFWIFIVAICVLLCYGIGHFVIKWFN